MSPAAFSAASLARRWGCSTRHIYNLIDQGTVRPFKIGNLYRVSAAEVARIEQCGSNSTVENGQQQDGQTVSNGAGPWVPRIVP